MDSFRKSKKQITCGSCGTNCVATSPSQKYCIPCGKTKRRERLAAWHKEARKDPGFRAKSNESSTRSYYKDVEKSRESRRNYNRRIKRMVLDHYGKYCVCCGEKSYEFLVIDHINGGGNKHRKVEGFKNVYAWLKTNKYPSGFRVLCQNCNSSLGFFGYCPHEDPDAHEKLLETLA